MRRERNEGILCVYHVYEGGIRVWKHLNVFEEERTEKYVACFMNYWGVIMLGGNGGDLLYNLVRGGFLSRSWCWPWLLGGGWGSSLGSAGLEAGKKFTFTDTLQVQITVVVLAVKRPSSSCLFFAGTYFMHILITTI